MSNLKRRFGGGPDARWVGPSCQTAPDICCLTSIFQLEETRLFLPGTIFENFDATKLELRRCPDSSMKKLPPPTPERCERRLFPQNNHEKRRFVCKKRGLPEPHPGRPRRPPPLHKKNKQYRCQPVCSRKHRRVSAWRKRTGLWPAGSRKRKQASCFN